MDLIKFGTKEKTEEEKIRELNVKRHTALSRAIQLITDEYPEKFLSAKKINGSIHENTITITGDLNIFNSEVYEKIIELNGEKDTYKIILKPLKKD